MIISLSECEFETELGSCNSAVNLSDEMWKTSGSPLPSAWGRMVAVRRDTEEQSIRRYEC